MKSAAVVISTLRVIQYADGLNVFGTKVKKKNTYKPDNKSTNTRFLQKVLTLGSDYFSATFYQTYFYYKPSKFSPFTETHFCNLLSSREKQINSLLLVSVVDLFF